MDTGHAGRLHSRKRARGHLQPRCRGGGGEEWGKGCRRRHRSGGGPPASREADGRGRHSAAQRTCARRVGRPTRPRAGGWDRLPRDGAPLAAPLDGVRNRRRAAATKAGAQARSPTGHRGRVEPRKSSLRAVAARNSGRWGGAGVQAPSGPCDRAVFLSHVTLFAFSVIATLPTLTRPQIPEDTNADCHL